MLPVNQGMIWVEENRIYYNFSSTRILFLSLIVSVIAYALSNH